jgi:hypothetical protein
MALIVQKYGGTSVGSIERIENVAEKVIGWRERGHQIVVVVSAMSGETDRLIGLAKGITPRPNPREMDVLLATGEQVTIALLCIALEKRGCPARSYTGNQVRILTDNAFNKARIEDIEVDSMHADLNHAGGLWWWRGSKVWTKMATSRPWVGAVLIPPVWRWPPRSRPMNARFTRMWMGSIPRIPRVVPDARRLESHHLRGDAGNGQPGVQGLANPLGGIRRQT